MGATSQTKSFSLNVRTNLTMAIIIEQRIYRPQNYNFYSDFQHVY